MRSIQNILGVVAAVATTSHAYLSDYWTHWDDMMATEINCQHGPATCGSDEDGNDVNCMDGYACLRTVFGDKCDDVARYQCSKDCGEGNVLNPLRYCTCITVEERDDMFCAQEASLPEPEPEVPDSESDEEEPPLPGAQILIRCDADNSTVYCNSGTQYCYDNS